MSCQIYYFNSDFNFIIIFLSISRKRRMITPQNIGSAVVIPPSSVPLSFIQPPRSVLQLQPQYFAQTQINSLSSKATITCIKANPKWWWVLLCLHFQGKPDGFPADLYIGASFKWTSSANGLFSSRANLCATSWRFESKYEWRE